MDSALVLVALCLASVALSAAICSQAGRLGRIFGLIDHPDGSLKRHVEGVPLIGGLALLVPSLSVSLLYFTQVHPTPYMVVFIAATVAAMILGAIDDKMRLSARLRFFGLAVIVFAVFSFDPLTILNAFQFGVADIDLRISLGVFAIPLTALIILGFVNAANLSDGMNGQLLGSILIWSLFLSRYLGFDSGLPLGFPFMVFVASASVVFVFNIRERLFSGSAGAYGASLFIALSTIAAYRRGGALSAVEPVLWFWLPVLDCVRVMIGRAVKGTPLFFGDRSHFHHILQDTLGARYALPAYLVLLAAPGTAAAFWSGRLTGLLVLIACVVCYAALTYLHFRQTKSTSKPFQPLAFVRSFFSTRFLQGRSGHCATPGPKHLMRPSKIKASSGGNLEP